MTLEAGMQAGPLPYVGRDVEDQVEQQRYWENIRTLVNKGDWASVLRILRQDRDNIRSSIAQLLQHMNSDKDTIVHRAAFDGQTKVVAELLLLIKEDNQEPWRERLANIHGCNPLHLAAMKWGHDDTCKCIAKMLPELAMATNKDGNTPLHLAAALSGNKDTCKYLAEMARETAKARNADGETPIFMAALNGHEGAFNTLTSMFLDDREIALARRNDGDTILHCAISGEYFDLASTIMYNHKELIYYSNEEGLTPLHLLANNPSAFKSGCQLGLLEHLFYSGIKVSTESKSDDLEHQEQEECGQSQRLQGAYKCVKQTLENFVSIIKCFGNLIFGCVLIILAILYGQSHKKPLNWLILIIAGLVLVIACCGIFFALLPMLCLLYIAAIFGFAWWRWIEKIRKIREQKQKHKWAKKVMKQLVDNIDNWQEFGKWTRGINPAMQHVKEIPPFTSQQEREITSALDTNSMQKDPQMHTDNKRDIIESPFLIAGKKGVIEMVRAILKKFPMAIHDMDLEGKNIMQLAAEHREHGIYEYVLERIDMKSKRSLLGKVDAEGNSVLHLAAKYPKEQSVLIPGAASQMYYEYRWFKFVKHHMPPHLSNQLNRMGQTAMEVFIETHQELAMERAKWLRNASKSCSVVAALITTVAFATISTVPGGLRQDIGSPVFQGRDNFNIFSLSSFIAFCFSALSLIMFLGILFFPSQDLDFGNNRPSNLIWGINSLFVSIVAMFLSFFFGDLLVLDTEMKYVAYPIFALTFCLAVSRCPSYFGFTSQAAFYSEFRDFIPGGIPKRAYRDNLCF